MPKDNGRNRKQEPEEDKYLQALEVFKKRSFATFAVVLFVIAMLIILMAEAAGARNIWHAIFH